jgi:TDG/mug DNA glycosylase family protein
MSILPDYLEPGLRAVFCGTAASEVSARAEHYYSGPGNRFWEFLFRVGLTPVLLVSQEDWRVVEFGLGLTDLAKEVAAGSDAMIAGEDYDVAGFRKKMEEYRPAWVAFHGKEAAKVFLRAQGSPKAVRNGRQRWKVASSEVFVLPSASAANQSRIMMARKID